MHRHTHETSIHPSRSIFKLEVVISEKRQSMIHTHTLAQWMIYSSQWRSKYLLRTDHKERIWKCLLNFTFNSEILISLGNFFSKLTASFCEFDTFICTKSPMVAAKFGNSKAFLFNVLVSHSLTHSSTRTLLSLAHGTTLDFGVLSLRWSLAFCLQFMDGIWFYAVWFGNSVLLLMIPTWQRLTFNGLIAMKLATVQFCYTHNCIGMHLCDVYMCFFCSCSAHSKPYY